MQNYEKQAIDFLKKTNCTLEVRFIKFDKYFNKDDQRRDIWEFRLKRGQREYMATFGSSISDHEEMLFHFFKPEKSAGYIQQCIDEYRQMAFNQLRFKVEKFNKEIENLKQWRPAGSNPYIPSNYSILACLDGYEVPEDIDEFMAEFGYTSAKTALKVHADLKRQLQGLRELFTDAELDLLNEIN